MTFRWTNQNEESGMGILQVSQLTGFAADTSKLLDDNKLLERVEMGGKNVIMYMNEVTNMSYSCSIHYLQWYMD